MKVKISGRVKGKQYDERNLIVCKCGCGKRLPSKKMLAEFLKRYYKDIDADVDIWAGHNMANDEITIHLELMFKHYKHKRK